ncbi:MAG TPA: CHASE3 domain-containing protein [Terriglobales bacterium]|nr:CHASE3 domain-containing protein [Terriglobales bacterium]
MKLTVERTVLAGFVIVLALLGTVGIVSQRTIIGLIEDSKWVTHTHVVLELLQQVSFRMSQAEAAIRGYVITGDTTFEAQYEGIRKQVPDLISELRTQTLDNPGEQSNISSLETLLEKRFATMDEGIRVRKSGGLQAILALGSTGPGRKLSAEISALTAQMRGDEDRLLVDRNMRAQASARRAFLVVLSALVVAMFAVIGSVVLVFRDLTRRQQIERMKSEFVSVVSHELRTPLTSIHGSLALLASGLLGRVDAKGTRMLEIAVSNTDRLIRLLNDILDIEKLDSGKMDIRQMQCSARELIEHAIDVMRPMAQNQHITLSAKKSELFIYADRDQCIQCLTNLLSNAIKFSEPGGMVKVAAKSIGTHAQFEVSDQGRGIPENKKNSIFERFHQVDTSDSRKRGGTGLGLAISRSIVEQHGGKIWVESQLGIGSTFFFTVPLAQTHNPNPTLYAESTETVRSERESNAETHPAD